MSSVDDIVSAIPISSLAGRLGVDEATAESAVRLVLTALLAGMQSNAVDPNGAAALASALEQHSPKLVDGGVNLDEVDIGDGERIVEHIFGDNTGKVAALLGGYLGDGGGDLVKKLLPILAPIVLSYLSGMMQDQTADPDGAAGFDIGGMLREVADVVVPVALHTVAIPVPGGQIAAGLVVEQLREHGVISEPTPHSHF